MILSTIKNIIKPIYKLILPTFWRLIRWKTKGCCIGNNVIIFSHVTMYNPQYISIGDNVTIQHHSSLFVNPLEKSASLKIGNGVRLSKYTDLGCSNKIVIEDNVIIAPYVHITDRNHSFQNIDIPIKEQPTISKGPVIIKTGTWLGFGVQVMSGVTIGRHCVIAAGSIVTKDIPDYCVAGGNPAKILKKFNKSSGKWEKI